MKITVIQAHESLAEKAGEILLASASLQHNLVVFPGKRPAHFLRRFLAEKTGGALRAPRVVSMDAFIDLAAERLGLGGRTATQLELVQLLYSGLRAGLCEVIGRGPDELPLDAVLPWALKVLGDLEELKIELKTPRELAAYDALLPEDLRPDRFVRKLEKFSGLYGAFYEAAEKAGLLTRSMKYAAVARDIERLDLTVYGNVIFAGFFALTASEKLIVSALARRGAQLLLQPGPGLEEQFAFLGKLPAVPVCKPPVNLRLYKAPDMHGEIFKLAELLAAGGAGDGSSTVIALPDARALFPLAENALPYVGEHNISMGYPLAATPVYALLDALADLLDRRTAGGYFAPDYLKFILHPYIKNFALAGSAEAGRIVMQGVEARVSALMNKFVDLRALETDGELGAAAAGDPEAEGTVTPEQALAHVARLHAALIKPLEEIKDLGDFARKLLDLISHISQDSTARLHPYWAPFAGRTIECLMELASSPLAGEKLEGPAAYFKFFRTFTQGVSYPFAGTPLKGLQVLGPLETRGLRFDRVFFLDANSDLLPSSRKEEAVLSHFVREALGLSTYRTRERMARYYFTALISGAKEAHIFYKDSADKERSPFVEKLAWDLERAGGGPDERDVHFRAKFSQSDPAPVEKTPELIESLRNRQFSPSAVDAYLNCGLRFYYRYGLRLREKEAISGEIEQSEVGNMVHKILENFFRPRLGRPLGITRADYPLMQAEALKVFDLMLKGHAAGFEYLVKRQVERRLADILDHHRAALAGITILNCELELRAELPTKYGPVKLRGLADRVDLRGGCTHIVDYKTGSAAAAPDWSRFDLGKREEWPKTLKSVQLPFYLLARLAAYGGDIKDMDASLMLFGGESITETSLFRERNRKFPDKAALFGTFREGITVLIEEILDPAKPFLPAAEEAACAGCAFRVMCGRQWVQ